MEDYRTEYYTYVNKIVGVYNRFSRKVVTKFAKDGQIGERILFKFDNDIDCDLCYIKCIEWQKMTQHAFRVQIGGHTVTIYKAFDD